MRELEVQEERPESVPAAFGFGAVALLCPQVAGWLVSVTVAQEE